MTDVRSTSLILWNDAAATPPVVLAGSGQQQRLAATAAPPVSAESLRAVLSFGTVLHHGQ
jgi:hypothetical protein